MSELLTQFANAVHWLAPEGETEEDFMDMPAPITLLNNLETDTGEGFDPAFMDILHHEGSETLEKIMLKWYADTFDIVLSCTGSITEYVWIPYYGVEYAALYDTMLDGATTNILRVMAWVDALFEDEQAKDEGEKEETYRVNMEPQAYVRNQVAAAQETLIDCDDDYDDNCDNDENLPEAAMWLWDTDEVEYLIDATIYWKDYIRVMCASIFGQRSDETPIDPIWQAVASALGWIFKGSGNSSVDMSEEENAEGGYAEAGWDQWVWLKSLVDEAIGMMDMVDEGIKLLLTNEDVAQKTAAKLSEIRRIVKLEKGLRVGMEYPNVEWKPYCRAIELWANSPARGIRRHNDGHAKNA